ncbi:protein MLP1 homolog isoform X5 [Cryptotermes secundus]|uniref:protein MLP1 homolog isoform X5 n=1 Tax=Cryptotermes secundus TaxID=105785 RepID=UPI000CD7C2C6|nr:protein MLP1 homolog isoform X5 [Cryptotermes secundus]
MQEPATTNSTLTKRMRTSTAEMTAVPLLQALLYQLRSDLNTTRMAFDSERAAMRALKRDRAAEIKAVREEEAEKCRNLLSDLKSRLERDHENALQRQKDAITKTLNSGMLHELKTKDAEMRQALKEAQAREESLKLQLRDAVRAGRDAAGAQQTGASSGAIQKLQQEVTELRLQNKQLEERLQVVTEADRQKAYDLRSQHEEHEMKLVQLRKTSQLETHKLLGELKSKERTILQLERQLNLQTGRVQEQRERLLKRQHEAHTRECDCSEVNYTRAREKRLVQRLGGQHTIMKKAVDTHAQDKKEMVSGDSDEELETRHRDVGTRNRATGELQEETKDKNRKFDQLTNRHRKEEMRRYYRHFMELEPVVELEEDSGGGEDSPTSSSSPSLSPQSDPEDMWAKLPDKRYHDTLYSCLLKEHLELQREYQFLQTRLKKELAEPNRIRLRLEHELAAARTHARKLKRKLADQEGGSSVLKERIAALQAEVHDLREQNELLEFRILELEECHENLSVRSHGPDTRDVWTDTESDDVSDSGVQSSPSSDTDDNRMEIRNEELKDRLLELSKTSSSTADRCCLQQVLVLLENYETRIEEVPQDSPTGGRALRNPSETAGINDSSKLTSRIIATVLPFIDQSVDTDKNSNDREGDEIKKQLKNAECLQESGIFEDVEYNSQGTQTDSMDVEPLVGEGKTCVVGDLSAEIQRLNQFRERVEEAGNCCGNRKLLRVGEGRVDEPPPQQKELQYCRERLQLLEDKVLVYESNGELQTRLLAERLQREVLLSAQVKDLTAKVQHFVVENRRLEEEKCEFEEAENDTRLKCQKLEVKLAALSEKKADLQTQLQQERRTINRLRSTLSESERKEQESKAQLNYFEALVNKYEQRNYDLEEREVELRHRLEMLENSMPVLLMWNMWRLMQNTEISRVEVTDAMSSALVKASTGSCVGDSDGSVLNTSLQLSVRRCPAYPDVVHSSRLRDVEQEQEKTLAERHETENTWRTTEEWLRSRLQFLEAQTGLMNVEIQRYKESEDKYKKRISELENEFYIMKNGSQVTSNKASDPAHKTRAETELNQNQPMEVRSVKCGELGCERKLQELLQSEADMKKLISELETKERAYMETLQQADELWSDMENSYKKRISKAEDNESMLREKVRKLEEIETKLREAFQHDEENEMLLEKIQNMEKSGKMFTEKIRILKTEKDQLIEEINQLRDALQTVQNELEGTKKMVARPMKEELLKERKLSKTLQNEITKLERELRDKSNAQQAQINGLKMQLSKTSRELVDLECTNGELKEEVETLEAKISELKAVIEQQKQNEEKVIIKMSQTILQKEQELEEAKREMRYSQTPNAQEELNQVDKSVLQDLGRKVIRTEETLKPEASEPEKAKEARRQPSEGPRTKPCGCRCSCENEQPPPVSTTKQKPVLRRWLLSQTLQPKESSHWRHC